MKNSKEIALLFGTFLIAISGLVYELLEGTLSSYLLGDSVYHFSLVIGLFVSSMGVGAWLSRFIDKNLEEVFIKLQLSISLLGGFSTFILFYAFAYIKNYDSFLYLITISLGSMLGLEIPLIIRILKKSFSLKSNISNVFTVDYIGAFFASLLFPLVLVPKLGLMQTSFLFGAINLSVGVMAWYIFRNILSKRYILYFGIIFTILIFGFLKSNQLTSLIESHLYKNSIIYSKQTPYQKIIVTAYKGRVQLYINGAIQFDTIDEYRYHESLVHPIMINSLYHNSVLIIGGGDGLALREILKYKDVKKVTLIDLDPTMTNLFKINPILSKLNHHSYNSKRVNVINQDAWKFIENSNELYDIIIIDLPDPNSISLSRLYSKSFYTLLKNHLSRAGSMVTQASSPLYTKNAFWSITKTIRSTNLYTLPYHTYIPSFGEWGFVLASKLPIKLDSNRLPKDLKYIDRDILPQLFIFPKDISEVDVEINTLTQHNLINYYNSGWKIWYE